MNRRIFIQGAAIIAAGDLLSIPLKSQTNSSSDKDLASGAKSIGGIEAKQVMKVYGWDELGDPSRDEVFIRVNHSWRAAWR
jgi:hypothetical protein